MTPRACFGRLLPQTEFVPVLFMNPRYRALLIGGFTLAGSVLYSAESLVLTLAPSDHPDKVALDLIVLNRDTTEHPFRAPEKIAGELVVGPRSWSVELTAERARILPGDETSTRPSNSGSLPVAIAPGRFTASSYTLVLPPNAPCGRAFLEVRLAGFAPARAVIDIGAGSLSTPDSNRVTAPAPAQRPPTNLVRAQPAAAALKRMFADRLSAHESIYFIYGADAPAAKFQLSFKYKLLDFTDVAPQRMTRTLQFAFTQRSLWDINGVSSPFYDTSYMPELIYESLAPTPEDSDHWFTWLGFQAAFKHESNGRDGPLSRSLNIVYARPVFALGQLDGWHLLVVPELFNYLSSLDDNGDLKDYRGYGQLRLVLGRNDGPSLMAAVWGGKDFDHPSVQLDLTFPIRTRLLNFETYLLVQYFNGYGESLLSYRAKSETVRAGLSLVR